MVRRNKAKENTHFRIFCLLEKAQGMGNFSISSSLLIDLVFKANFYFDYLKILKLRFLAEMLP
ncbi:hypothetical protein CWATWH8502_890 [Crocosphaera watsonii WH 8502]|uniref:Uncharacterized protein n=4 Tax=Crocosphaera watsonii TaxID=263511 RepID=G5J3J0_CROWT|nr:hypothetical protein CWATWH0003_2066 [Crocosphaera watsonii WH 0003]NQZ61776.1 hypothetical protein [Crocosphaera sp.]CCQ50398.1 hypothetical protein CWATWH8502_890 [Crocosphaera watsonii WH 8502]CCQ54115.1 hypothetical protein CWATWH0005_5506 [Crocosphaera watsonii WH 0005]CCQ61548.1 hypothetical protein CWATWH0401_4259 [Crocosphaera watsonii WH 0401]